MTILTSFLKLPYITFLKLKLTKLKMPKLYSYKNSLD